MPLMMYQSFNSCREKPVMVLQIMPTEDLPQNIVSIQLNREGTEAEKSLKIKYSVLAALSPKKSTCMLYYRHDSIVSLEMLAKYVFY